MTEIEVKQFIEIMKDVCIDYTPEEVMEEYGDLTLREAIEKRLNKIQAFYDYVEEFVRPDAEALGLWPKGMPIK